jgi:hypothetical protein
MIALNINGKEICLHWGALVAEWLWLDTIGGEVTTARSDWGPVALFYAHKNWQRCDPDSRKLQATKGDFYKWFETASDEVLLNVFAGYEEGKAKERWDKLAKDLNDVLENEKKILIETSGGTVSE